MTNKEPKKRWTIIKITVLLDNLSKSEAIQSRHGLSLWVETEECRFLFDFGPDETFLENAKQMGVHPEEADFAVLSHAHCDHSGGLGTFLQINKDAKVYMRPSVFENHSNLVHYNGIDLSLKGEPQMVMTSAVYPVNDRIRLFSEVHGQAYLPKINGTLLENGRPDRFSHEQNLLLEERGKLILIGGCAHCGIVNIMEKACEIAGRYPDYVISGFHLSLHGKSVSRMFIRSLAAKLKTYRDTTFYTCHCTGSEPFAALKEQMEDSIHYLSAGSRIEILER